MSSDSTRLLFSVSGTSPLTMRCARPSTIAVLPTPGSPISTGLFLVRRCRIWMVRRISSSRPITGSSLPSRARAVRSIVYLVERLALALGFLRVSHPRRRAPSRWRLRAPCGSGPPPSRCVRCRPLSPVSASRNSSLAMNWSPRLVASLSVRLSRLLRSRETVISPPWPSTLGSRSMEAFSAACSLGTWTPARASSDVVPPSSCASSAASRCCGSMKPLSWPSARLWASANACWNLVVSLSKRMESPFNSELFLIWGDNPAVSTGMTDARPAAVKLGAIANFSTGQSPTARHAPTDPNTAAKNPRSRASRRVSCVSSWPCSGVFSASGRAVTCSPTRRASSRSTSSSPASSARRCVIFSLLLLVRLIIKSTGA